MLPTPIVLRGLAYRATDGAEVRDVDLDVGHGELVALVGPGADEALAVLAGLRRARAGEALVAGRPLARHRRPPRVAGVVPAHGDLAPARTIRDHLRISARLAGVPTALVAEAAQRAGLAPGTLRARPPEVGGLERRRAALAGALLGSPVALVLPAPLDRLRDTSDLWALGTQLRREAADGRAVLFSCADPRVAAAVAHRAVAVAGTEVAA